MALSITLDNLGDGMVKTSNSMLPESLQGGHILVMAAGIRESRPLVDVLTSNGAV